MTKFNKPILENIVDDARRREKEWNKFKIKLNNRYGYKYKLVTPDDKIAKEVTRIYKEINNKNEVALYIVLRVDPDIADRLTLGQYCDFVAESMKIGAFQAGPRSVGWINSGYNRIILAANGAREIGNLLRFVRKRDIPHKPLFKKFKGKRESKQKALVGIAIGPYDRDVVHKATYNLPLF